MTKFSIYTNIKRWICLFLLLLVLFRGLWISWIGSVRVKRDMNHFENKIKEIREGERKRKEGTNEGSFFSYSEALTCSHICKERFLIKQIKSADCNGWEFLKMFPNTEMELFYCGLCSITKLSGGEYTDYNFFHINKPQKYCKLKILANKMKPVFAIIKRWGVNLRGGGTSLHN